MILGPFKSGLAGFAECAELEGRSLATILNCFLAKMKSRKIKKNYPLLNHYTCEQATTVRGRSAGCFVRYVLIPYPA